MKVVSDNFAGQMDMYPYIARMTLDDVDIIQGEPIQAISFSGGTNGDNTGVTIGCAVAASATVTIDRTLTSISLSSRKVKLELGMEIGGIVEWLSMGEYKVTDVQENDGVTVATCLDAIAADFEEEYENIDGFDFSAGTGVSAKDFVTALCNRRNVKVDISECEDIKLAGYVPIGHTERELLGMIAGLYGKFALIDRDGILRFRWYVTTDVEITANEYYEDGLEKAGYLFSVGWLKCYCEPLDETLIEGELDADQGIYFASPWMTPEILSGIWERVRDFSYTPVTGLSFLGDPRIDPGDIITLKNLDGVPFSVPAMVLYHEYDGGLRTTVIAQGQSKSDAYEGPVQRTVKQATSKILKKVDGIELSVQDTEKSIAYLELKADSIEGRVDDTEGNIADLEVRADGIDVRIEDAEGDIANLQATADGLITNVSNAQGDASEAKQTAAAASQTVSTMDGRLTKVEQTAGMVSVEVKDDNGNVILSTYITADAWAALRTEGGEITSGFYYDFELGRFIYKGAGEFYSEDGTTFAKIEGNRLVLYSCKDTDEPVEKLSVGFITGRDPDNTQDVDYPFIQLGANTNEGQVGLVKKFWDGMWVGNSYPKNASGRFVPKANYGGFFISTVDAKSYVVFNENMQNVYTGEAIAKFR